MSDIVERLRHEAQWALEPDIQLYEQSADEIERLRSRLSLAEEAAASWYWEYLVSEGTDLLTPEEKTDE